VAFQWDAKKAQANAKKHAVRFADAVSVFEDAHALTIDDPHPSEPRFVTLGLDLWAACSSCAGPREQTTFA
jgi:uncharacterized DUF497 family protein